MPHEDPPGNDRMAREALLDHVPCPTANVPPMPTDCSIPDGAARDYETTLRSFFAGDAPQFDLVLLGLGPDGHTASLFPGSPALDERTRWVLAVTAPAEPPVRLTLTLPAPTRAAHTDFPVTGSTKTQEHHPNPPGAADPAGAGARLGPMEGTPRVARHTGGPWLAQARPCAAHAPGMGPRRRDHRHVASSRTTNPPMDHAPARLVAATARHRGLRR